MTDDPDAIGDDGTVRLRRYVRLADTHWLVGICSDCSRLAPIGIRPAIAMLGGEATVGELAWRLRCMGCGGRRVLIQIAADPRPAETQRRDGPRPETRADPRQRG
jgi:hypothetical protein